MGYIECSEHGGNVASFVSKYHVNKANQKELCLKNELLEVKVIDSEKLFDGTYLADSKLVRHLRIKSLKINYQIEPKKFEAFFEAFVLVCPICLNEYLNSA